MAHGRRHTELGVVCTHVVAQPLAPRWREPESDKIERHAHRPAYDVRDNENAGKAPIMPTGRRGISAEQLARDYGVSLNEFADEVITLLASLPPEDARAPAADRCREGCAAVWAAMVSALDSSSLTTEERVHLTPLLLDVLVPFWRKHCADERDIVVLLQSRAAYYLRDRDPVSQIRTAAHLVGRLLQAVEVSENVRTSLATTLTASFAHRMLGDIHRINEVRSRFGIELPMFAALTALVQATMTYEPALRMLRIV
jgi:hypothetical protein